MNLYMTRGDRPELIIAGDPRGETREARAFSNWTVLNAISTILRLNGEYYINKGVKLSEKQIKRREAERHALEQKYPSFNLYKQ